MPQQQIIFASRFFSIFVIFQNERLGKNSLLPKRSSDLIDLAADDAYLCAHHMHSDKEMINNIETQLIRK